jgi:hypothetical protein
MVLIGGKFTLSYAPNGPECCGVVMARNDSGDSTGAFSPSWDLPHPPARQQTTPRAVSESRKGISGPTRC